MASTREIITFQLGNYANYVAAHWWNIQESYFEYDERNPSEINHDVLFREGSSLKGLTTFTPRAILVDKVENLANAPVLAGESISQSLNLKMSESKIVLLPEELHKIPEKHEYIKDLEKIESGQSVNFARKNYDFSKTVRTWCDFLKTKYHPRSVKSYPDSYQSVVFHSGAQIFRKIEENLADGIRVYMEECDNLQGFQLLTDGFDASAGVADSLLVLLKDEYASKSVFVFPVFPGNFPNCEPVDDVTRTVNIMLAYQKLAENASQMVPLGTSATVWRNMGPPTRFPNIVYNNTCYYQTSAIIASFLDTITLKYRFREKHSSLNDYINLLRYQNNKISAASMSLPFPMTPESYLLSTLENLDEHEVMWSRMTPGCDLAEDAIVCQKIILRGIPDTRLRDPRVQMDCQSHKCTNVSELVQMYLSYRMRTISEVDSAKTPLKTLLPYPKIFSPHVSPVGNVDRNSRRMDNVEVESCPVVAGIHSGKGVGRMLESLHKCVTGIDIKRFHYFLDGHMDIDEFNDCLNKILTMGYGYLGDVELR